MPPRLMGTPPSCRELLLTGRSDAVPDEALLEFLLGVRATQGAPPFARDDLPSALWRLTAEDLITLPGVGPAGAARVLACVELSRRAATASAPNRPRISTPEDVVALCWPQLRGADREHFWTLALNTKNHLVRIIEVSVGSLNASIVHPRELFRDAVRVAAASIVAVHNHPSGDPTPSSADVQLTRRLVRAGDVIGIELLDHVVIGDGGEHSSMRELGLM